jgi:hypothetical protein
MNFKHLFNTGEKISDEPFILASQAVQVFYVPNPIDIEWVAVVQPKPQDLYGSEDGENDILDDDNDVAMTIPYMNPNVNVSVVGECVPCARTNIDGIIVNRVKYGNKSRTQVLLFLFFFDLIFPFLIATFSGN